MARHQDARGSHEGQGGGETSKADATNEDSQRYAAALLQKRLDGYQGTCGDIADYLRVIQALAD